MIQPTSGTTRRAFVAGLAAPLAAAVVAPTGLRAQDATLRVATSVSTFFAGPYLAADLGMYQRAGISADVTGLSNGELVITAVATGSADFGVTATLQLATAVAHDVPVRLVGYCGQFGTSAARPLAGLYVVRDSPLRDAKSLEGKTVGVNALQSTNFLGVQAWLAQNNVDISKIRSIEVPFSQIGAALQRGTIDAGVLAEPFSTAARDNVRLFAPVFETLGPSWSVSVYFARTDYIRANPAMVRRFLDVSYQTAKYVNAHPEQANPILAKYTKLPLETLNAIPPTPFAEGPVPATARIELELAYKYKLIARPLTVNDMTNVS